MIDFKDFNLADLVRKVRIIESETATWRGENGDAVRQWIAKFWRLKTLKARREAARRAYECWLCA